MRRYVCNPQNIDKSKKCIQIFFFDFVLIDWLIDLFYFKLIIIVLSQFKKKKDLTGSSAEKREMKQMAPINLDDIAAIMDETHKIRTLPPPSPQLANERRTVNNNTRVNQNQNIYYLETSNYQPDDLKGCKYIS